MTAIALASRELGAYPLSVGTSLALEACRDNPREHYSYLYVNVWTLFRNLYSALTVADSSGIHRKDWVETLAEEIVLFNRIAKEVLGDTPISFYVPDYRKTNSLLPKAKLRPHNTAKQLYYKVLSEEVVGALKFLLPRLAMDKITIDYTNTTTPPTIKSKALLLSHYALDLLSCPWDARLLESHTGKVKDRSLWSSKLAGTADYSIIPLNKLTLTVFGDNTLIAPQPQVARRDLYAVGVERKWTSLTTYDYVKRSVLQMRDYGMRDLFTEMF